jgi:hypothetical protein
MDVARDLPPADVVSDGASPLDGPGIFVAVGYGGRRVRSLDDGMTWVDDMALIENGGDDAYALRAVAWGNKQFVSLGFRVMTSPDGKTWHDFGANAVQQWFGSVVYAKGLYVAVGGYGLRDTSTDAVTWMDHHIDTVASHLPNGLIYDDAHGTFVSANDNGLRAFSLDGKAWTMSTGATTTTTRQLAAGNGIIVAVDGTNVALSGDGGMTWAAAPALAVRCQAIVFAQGHFLAIASGHAYTSTDGSNWTDHPVANLNAGMVVYGHGTYVLFDNLKLRRSTDGLTWAAPITLPGTNALVAITFGPSG